jgi:hypothetical protein
VNHSFYVILRKCKINPAAAHQIISAAAGRYESPLALARGKNLRIANLRATGKRRNISRCKRSILSGAKSDSASAFGTNFDSMLVA